MFIKKITIYNKVFRFGMKKTGNVRKEKKRIKKRKGKKCQSVFYFLFFSYFLQIEESIKKISIIFQIAESIKINKERMCLLQ